MGLWSGTPNLSSPNGLIRSSIANTTPTTRNYFVNYITFCTQTVSVIGMACGANGWLKQVRAYAKDVNESSRKQTNYERFFEIIWLLYFNPCFLRCREARRPRFDPKNSQEFGLLPANRNCIILVLHQGVRSRDLRHMVDFGLAHKAIATIEQETVTNIVISRKVLISFFQLASG